MKCPKCGRDLTFLFYDPYSEVYEGHCIEHGYIRLTGIEELQSSASKVSE